MASAEMVYECNNRVHSHQADLATASSASPVCQQLRSGDGSGVTSRTLTPNTPPANTFICYLCWLFYIPSPDPFSHFLPHRLSHLASPSQLATGPAKGKLRQVRGGKKREKAGISSLFSPRRFASLSGATFPHNIAAAQGSHLSPHLTRLR